jgi:hypothetical protein
MLRTLKLFYPDPTIDPGSLRLDLKVLQQIVDTILTKFPYKAREDLEKVHKLTRRRSGDEIIKEIDCPP